MNARTEQLWDRRIAKAAALLGRRLDDPPTLDEMAASASVSPFHFHRIWRAMTGETVGQSLVRMRIEAAKEQLIQDRGVTEVAMATGFATPQSFARAFRRETGTSPTAWRTAGDSGPRSEPVEGQVEIVRRDTVTVVALRRTGGAYVELNALFQALWDWAEKENLLSGLEGLYGIPLDDPQSVAVDHLRFDAGLSLGLVEAPQPFHQTVLPGGSYARLLHRGSYAGLEIATQALMEWLAASGTEPADEPLFYRYLNDPDQTSEGDLETEILLPLLEVKS